MSGPESSDMQAEIDALVEASRDGTSKMGEHALWRAVVNLPAWYFVANSAEEDCEPTVGVVDGRAHLLAFTEEERAAAFSARRAQIRGGKQHPVLHMEVDDAVSYCQSLMDAEVESVLFNSGKYAFQAGMIELKDKVRQFRS